LRFMNPISAATPIATTPNAATHHSMTASAAAKVVLEPVRAAAPDPRAKSQRISKLEASRLASFKALMKEFGGELSFAGYDG